MATLDPLATVPALPNRNPKGADPRPHDRQVFLILRRVTAQRDRATACRTGAWQRRIVGLINLRRGGAMRAPSIGEAGFSAGAARRPCGDAARKGRGLAMQRPPRIIELVLEPVDLLLQLVALLTIPVAVLIGPLVLASQSLDLALLSLQLCDQLVSRRRAPFWLEHASLMP